MELLQRGISKDEQRYAAVDANRGYHSANWYRLCVYWTPPNAGGGESGIGRNCGALHRITLDGLRCRTRMGKQATSAWRTSSTRGRMTLI